jgi:hypothetical protein
MDDLTIRIQLIDNGFWAYFSNALPEEVVLRDTSDGGLLTTMAMEDESEAQ